MYSLPHSVLAHTRSYATIKNVLKMASLPAILEAIEKSFDTKKHTVNVLQMAKRRQIKALAIDLQALSAPPFRPAELLFMRRSPTHPTTSKQAQSYAQKDFTNV